jgi:hypothetical protein
MLALLSVPYHLDPINGVQIDHALSHDLNGDGLVEFTLIVDPGAQLKNDTEIGINFDWNLDLIRADLTVPLPVGDLVDLLNDVFNFTAVRQLTEEIQLVGID